MKGNETLFHELKRVQAAWAASVERKTVPSSISGKIDKRLSKHAAKDEVNIENILELRRKGASYYKIASILNCMGVGAQRGGQWYSATIYAYIRNRYCELLCDWPKRV